MKTAHVVMIVAALVLAAGPMAIAQDATADAKWLTSMDEALAAAQKAGKPVLVDFTGSDWCGWCIKLRKEVFDTPEFKAWAAKNVILCEIDFPRQKKQDDATKKANEALVKKYGVEGFPTIIFVKADGKEIGRSGYRPGGPKAWTDSADAILKKAK